MKRETKIWCGEGPCLHLAWYIHTETKTVQFVVLAYTLEKPSSVKFEHTFKMLPSDLGYHADKPEYDGQTDMKCCIRPSGKCYYDGTSLGASDVWKAFMLTGKEETIWKALEDRL